MGDIELHSWAETTVYPKGTTNPSKAPCAGDPCAFCGRPFEEGETVHHPTELKGDVWVCDSHIWREQHD